VVRSELYFLLKGTLSGALMTTYIQFVFRYQLVNSGIPAVFWQVVNSGLVAEWLACWTQAQ